MNLPASAIEFLDAFNGAFSPDTWQNRQLPMVHCYTFKRGTESEAGASTGGGGVGWMCSTALLRHIAPHPTT